MGSINWKSVNKGRILTSALLWLVVAALAGYHLAETCHSVSIWRTQLPGARSELSLRFDIFMAAVWFLSALGASVLQWYHWFTFDRKTKCPTIRKEEEAKQ